MEIPLKDSSIIQVVDYLKLRHPKLLHYAITEASVHLMFYGFELNLAPDLPINTKVYLYELNPASYALVDQYDRSDFQAESLNYFAAATFLFNDPTPGMLPENLSFRVDYATKPNSIMGTGIRLTYTPHSNTLSLQQLYVLGLPDYSTTIATKILPKQPTDSKHLLGMLQNEIINYQKVIAL